MPRVTFSLPPRHAYRQSRSLHYDRRDFPRQSLEKISEQLVLDYLNYVAERRGEPQWKNANVHPSGPFRAERDDFSGVDLYRRRNNSTNPYECVEVKSVGSSNNQWTIYTSHPQHALLNQYNGIYMMVKHAYVANRTQHRRNYTIYWFRPNIRHIESRMNRARQAN